MVRGAHAPRTIAFTTLRPKSGARAPQPKASLPFVAMQRPGRFEAFRYIGDKRTQVVYDTDDDDPGGQAALDELMQSEQFVVFGPDTLGEVRNRGYHPRRHPAADERVETS